MEEGLERKAVRSTNIASVGYDAGTKTLEIEFRSGGVYQYAGVPGYQSAPLCNGRAVSSHPHSTSVGRYPLALSICVHRRVSAVKCS